jgi:hypothetical protein
MSNGQEPGEQPKYDYSGSKFEDVLGKRETGEIAEMPRGQKHTELKRRSRLPGTGELAELAEVTEEQMRGGEEKVEEKPVEPPQRKSVLDRLRKEPPAGEEPL